MDGWDEGSDPGQLPDAVNCVGLRGGIIGIEPKRLFASGQVNKTPPIISYRNLKLGDETSG